MKAFETKDYKAFSMFEDRWALVTAGTIDDFNTCTVSWGSMGNVWGPNGGDMSTVTVYIHPARYTHKSSWLNMIRLQLVSFLKAIARRLAIEALIRVEMKIRWQILI